MFSPTGYYAHYRTQFHNAGRPHGGAGVDVYPVVGYTDTALVIDEDGTVKTVGALLEELRAGGDADPDGTTWTVHLEVNGAPA